MGFRATISLCVLSAGVAGWGGCSPAEIELESEPMGLVDEGAGDGQPASFGCAMINLLGGSTAEVRYAVLPRTSQSFVDVSRLSDGDHNQPGVGASMTDCGNNPGDYELSVLLNGREKLREVVQVPDLVQSVLMVYAYSAHEPRWSIAQVDLSPAEPGLRRARVSNYIEKFEPIEVSLYDDSDQPVGESVTIAWGSTWVGTIPSAATAYRLSPSDAVSTPFRRPELESWFSEVQPTAGLPCVDAQPLGIVITGTYWEGENTVTSAPGPWRGASHVEERYTYLPPLCSES
jgi:hypothetical protein